MLNARQVETTKKPGRYHDGHGLYLQVRPSGARSWLYVFMLNRHQRQMGLGATDVVTLAEARELAHEARRLVKRGIDPIDQRRAARGQRTNAVTFRQAVDEFVELQAAGWRNPKTPKQFKSSLARHAYPLLGNLPVDAITVDHVMQVLSPIWHKVPVMADRIRSQIAMVLDAAKARGLRSGDNPARWQDAIKHMLPPAERVRRPVHHAALPYTDIPELMARLRKREGIAARCLEFTILTACRTNEAISATWAEVDFEQKVWTVPGSKMKSGREHRVPLVPAAIRLLGALPREADNPHLFVGHRRGRGLSNMAMLKLLTGLRSGTTVHGMRSAFRTWAMERTNVPREVAEAALAHVVGDRTEQAYARGDVLAKRRALMLKWAAFCSTLPG